MARPKLTPKLQQQICEVLREGNFVATACAIVRISEASYWGWRKRGEEELARLESDPKAKPRKSEARYVEFLEMTTRARHEAEQESVKRIRTAGESGDVGADQWFLERAFRDRWGKTRIDVQHSGAVEVTYKVEPPRILEDTDRQD